MSYLLGESPSLAAIETVFCHRKCVVFERFFCEKVSSLCASPFLPPLNVSFRHVKKVHSDWGEQPLPIVEETPLVESCLEITSAFQEAISFSDRMSIFKRWVNRMEFRPTFLDGDFHGEGVCFSFFLFGFFCPPTFFPFLSLSLARIRACP